MRKYLVCCIRIVFRFLGCSLTYLHLMKRRVIVCIDGGICSQIHFYLIGQLFAERGEKVEYDLSWYHKFGKDLTGNYDRNFDLLKLCPFLHFIESKRIISYIYSSAFLWKNNYYNEAPSYALNYLEKNSPVYLSGYYRDPSYLYTEMFHKYFNLDKSILDNRNIEILDVIQSKKNSVAVHVRRGDLCGYAKAYGNPASINYFSNAIKHIDDQVESSYYFFFSDEPDWVRNELLTRLPLDDNYWVVDINGSDKGYMDLFLIASCKHCITSKGTLGKYGALLNKNTKRIITLCDENTEYVWLQYIKGSLLIKM